MDFPSQDFCASQVLSPLATIIHLLVALLVAASYLPQLIEIATQKHTENISGWYIILLTTSASAHLAVRVKSVYGSMTWECILDGELRGYDAFSVLVIYLQAFIHWAAAIVLLAVYVSFRTPPAAVSFTASSSSPSNPVILAIVLTHAAIVLPSAIYIIKRYVPMLSSEDDYDLIVHFGLSSMYGIFLRVTGVLTSLAAFIPQIHLMLSPARSRDGNSNPGLVLGSGSLLSLGLQVIAFTTLAVAQGSVISPLGEDWRAEIRKAQWWHQFLAYSGLGAGWLALAFSQLVVLGVAVGVGGSSFGFGGSKIRLE
ncbi:hypothetical protein BDW74DRAFT_181767 [Aspergillus multicolor]|uniref:uncharacterized protein n=1 Tax=Aspergillus multicolor TaxID=41759 RepID=UPI003CCD8D88